VTDYQPTGGLGDKVFPPTYEGGKYAMEKRIDPATGEERQCVLLDSVQSQANRMELALLEIPDRGRPSVINHGNVTPDYDYVKDSKNQIQYETKFDESGHEVNIRRRILGGFTISKAVQTTTLSLAVLRRLRFPLGGAADSEHEVDLAARTALAALGLAAGTLARNDMDLRSRCHLFAEGASAWQLLDRPGETPREFALDRDASLGLLNEAIEVAKGTGLPWEGVIELTPSPDLVELVRRSQKLASEVGRCGGRSKARSCPGR